MTLKRLFKSLIHNALFDTKMYLEHKFMDITGDACVGDIVWFGKDEFSGSFRKPTFEGTRCIRAIITKESYGKDKQQHTFTMVPMISGTAKTAEKGREACFSVKGRNLYKHFTYCENVGREGRGVLLDEKHIRGEAARRDRDERKGERQ